MTIFIPPQQKSTTHYVRLTTITAFVICMLWLASYFFQEYQQLQHNRVAALKAINDIEELNLKIEQHNTKADEHNQQIEKQVVKKKKIIIREKIVKREEPSEPIGGGAALPTKDNEPVKIGEFNKAPELPKATPEEAAASIPGATSTPKPVPLTLPPQPKPWEKTCTDLKEAMSTGCKYEPPQYVTKTVEVEEKVPPPAPIEKQSKIEIDAGLVKVAMSNEASWMAIFKIVFTVLFTFFGIRLINFGFKRLEGEPKPA